MVEFVKGLTEDEMNEYSARYRFWSGIATFLRAPYRPGMEETDVGLIGFPYSGGNPVERMQHHGPRAVRNRSCAYQRAHRFLQIDPFEHLAKTYAEKYLALLMSGWE